MTDKGPTLNARALEQILEVTRKLASPFDLDTMLERVVDAGRAVLGADRGTVFLYDELANELFSTVATGMASVRFPADQGIAGECAQTKSVVNVPDCYADPRFNQEVDRKTGYRTRCLLSVPLVGYDGSLVGVLQLLNKREGTFDKGDEGIAAALAAQCAVALQRVRTLEELIRKEKMESELAVAREVQMGFLPKEPPPVSGYDLAGFSRAADEAGGDTYDLVPREGGQVVLLLGDATGHGIGPALSVTQVRAMLRVAVRLGADLDQTFAHINNQLVADLASNRLVTAFLGVLDPGDHTVAYHAPGQGPLLHFHASSGECEWLGPSAMPMGVLEVDAPGPPRTLGLEPGDILGLMTDGIFEYANQAGEMLGEQPVADLVNAHQGKPMAELIEILIQAAEEFGGSVPQGDDMTIVLVRRLPE